ncbi:hypothetical protein [Bosea sp. 117]|uniref:hypothetical protein n=1 Tax=Bosea sp. 117 TaxID=1125973 RepID=UPI00057183A2|nr:hypothetical protein [Bosea sp. 117]
MVAIKALIGLAWAELSRFGHEDHRTRKSPEVAQYHHVLEERRRRNPHPLPTAVFFAAPM